MATNRSRSARGPGVLLVAATGMAAGAVALDAGFNLPAALRAVLFAAWSAAVGVLGWGALGRSTRRKREAWVAGGAAVVAFGLVVVLVPGGARVSRLFPPWSAPPPAVRLTVTTGDPMVARGAGVTVACLCERRPGGGTSPVRLEVRDAAGEVQTVVPGEEVAGVCCYRVPVVDAPMTYRFTGGGISTAWHRVTPADPVTLLPGSLLTARPPTYAVGSYPTRDYPIGESVDCLTGGQICGHLVFSRPTSEILAVWTGVDAFERPIAVSLAADRRSATLLADVTTSGRVRLRLTGDDGYQSHVDLSVTAVPDHPPRFVAVTGIDSGRWTVQADEAIDLSVEVQDDYWATAPTLHLLVGPNSKPAASTVIPLTALSGGRFSGRLNLPLAGLWTDGRVECRLRLVDARRQDDILFPLTGGVEFVRVETAAPLPEQIVLAQRDRVAAHLSAAFSALSHDGDDTTGVLRHLDDAYTVVRLEEQLDPLNLDIQELLASIRRNARPDLRSAVTAVQELNRQLANSRLDRFRLQGLAATIRRHADKRLTADVAGRLRERLAAVTAASPRLSAARTAADRRAVADAVEAADRLADELDRIVERLAIDDANQFRTLSDRCDELARQLANEETRWATAARLAAAGRTSAALVQRGASLLRDARPADALAALDAAARQLGHLSAALTQAAEARADPREAARQLVRWRTDLDARSGPPPADELVRWHACAREVVAVARLHNPSGATSPEQIAHDFPTPAELKRRAAETLREVAASATTSRQSSEFLAYADRLKALSPPADAPPSRLAAAMSRRIAADLSAGRPQDAVAGTLELRWRTELLAQSLAKDGDTLGVPDELNSSRTGERLGVLALRLGLPPDLDGDVDALRAAVRLRLDGADTDQRRVSLMCRWWASRTTIMPEHVRDLLVLVDTLRVGDNPQPLADLIRTLRTAARTPGFKAEVASLLARLREGIGGSGESTLSSETDLETPTAAQRLIALDSGDRLPSRPLGEAVSRFAAQARSLAEKVAVVTATLRRTEIVTPLRLKVAAELEQIGSLFRQHTTSEVVTERWHNVGQCWNATGETSDTLRTTAAALRQLRCVVRPTNGVTEEELAIGRKLLDAEAVLSVEVRPGQTLERAARAIETAAQ